MIPKLEEDFSISIRNTFLHFQLPRAAGDNGEGEDEENCASDQPTILRSSTAPIVRYSSEYVLDNKEEAIVEEDNPDFQFNTDAEDLDRDDTDFGRDQDCMQDFADDCSNNPNITSDITTLGDSTSPWLSHEVPVQVPGSNRSFKRAPSRRAMSAFADSGDDDMACNGLNDAVVRTSSNSSNGNSNNGSNTNRDSTNGIVNNGNRPRQRQRAVTVAEANLDVDGKRTTVLLRNLPNNYTRQLLMDLLDSEGFARKYDFLYMPIDFRTHAALGYAFVNMVAPRDAENLRTALEGFVRWRMASNKVCRASWSHPHQGLETHIARYRSSPLMHEAVPDEYRPILFRDGQRIAFPPPTKKIKPPRQGTQRVLV